MTEEVNGIIKVFKRNKQNRKKEIKQNFKPNMPITILNVNGLHMPIKRQRCQVTQTPHYILPLRNPLYIYRYK